MLPYLLMPVLLFQRALNYKAQSCVKSTKKYTSVSGCKALAEKKSKAVAFNLDTAAGKCYLLKSVSGSSTNSEVVSGS